MSLLGSKTSPISSSSLKCSRTKAEILTYSLYSVWLLEMLGFFDYLNIAAFSCVDSIVNVSQICDIKTQEDLVNATAEVRNGQRGEGRRAGVAADVQVAGEGHLFHVSGRLHAAHRLVVHAHRAVP